MKRISPKHIKELKENEVFVFGSNEGGRHGKGAARLALDQFGAIYGQAEGLQGYSYGIPTKDKTVKITLTVEEIKKYVDNFITFAINNNHLKFLVTEIGCGLAGHDPRDIAPLFKNAKNVTNIYLPERFWDNLDLYETLL